MREVGKSGPRLLGDLIREFMKSRRMPRRGELAELRAAWGRAAGADVARRSEPVGFRNGALVVRFESSVLRHEVEGFRKEEILARLRAECPGRRIAALKCVLR